MTANKQRAIRTTLARLGMHATAKQVVDGLAAFGVEVSEDFVSRVKEQIRREESKAFRGRSKRPPEIKSRIQSSIRLLVETKTERNGVNLPQIRRHIARLDEAAESNALLLVLTSDLD